MNTTMKMWNSLDHKRTAAKIYAQYNEETGELMDVFSQIEGVKVPYCDTPTRKLYGKGFEKIKVGEKVQFTGHSYLIRTR